MTDARFPERWLNDRRVLRLSDGAFRLFVLTLAWSVANKTDGYLSDDDVPLIPGVNLDCARELADAELWWDHMHGWQITEFEETQTTSADLARLAEGRKKQREKKRRQRAHLALVPRDVPGDSPRTGQARTGQALRPKAKSFNASEVQPVAPSPENGDGPITEVHDDQQNRDEVLADASLQTVTHANGDGEAEKRRLAKVAEYKRRYPDRFESKS